MPERLFQGADYGNAGCVKFERKTTLLADRQYHFPKTVLSISEKNKDLSFVICRLSFVILKEMEMNAGELEERLIDFAVRIIRLADALPNSPAGKHIRRQLLRSGTSLAPNYAEARGAESKADFVHKLKIANKELNETCVWLRMVCHAELMPGSRVNDLIDENQQLARILNATIKTTRHNQMIDDK